MRQAGRIFPEYRRLREEHSFMEVCRDPALTSEVTRLPIEGLDVDAAIIFADLMFPLYLIGKDFDLVKGTGPVIDQPIRSPGDVQNLSVSPIDEQLGFFREAIERTRLDLDDDLGLIGFTGAPFTLACYLIEGQSSRSFSRARQFMIDHPEPFHVLMRILTEQLSKYNQLQVDAGVDAIQLFDSWVGLLSPGLYDRHVTEHVRTIFNELDDDTPGIYFGTGTPSLLNRMADTGPDVLGVDWRISLGDAQQRVDRSIPMQGNLDPSLLRGPVNRMTPHVDRILEDAQNLPGHVFNLGHGVHPDTPLESIRRLIQYVRANTSTLKSEN